MNIDSNCQTECKNAPRAHDCSDCNVRLGQERPTDNDENPALARRKPVWGRPEEGVEVLVRLEENMDVRHAAGLLNANDIASGREALEFGTLTLPPARQSVQAAQQGSRIPSG